MDFGDQELRFDQLGGELLHQHFHAHVELLLALDFAELLEGGTGFLDEGVELLVDARQDFVGLDDLVADVGHDLGRVVGRVGRRLLPRRLRLDRRGLYHRIAPAGAGRGEVGRAVARRGAARHRVARTAGPRTGTRRIAGRRGTRRAVVERHELLRRHAAADHVDSVAADALRHAGDRVGRVALGLHRGNSETPRAASSATSSAALPADRAAASARATTNR